MRRKATRGIVNAGICAAYLALGAAAAQEPAGHTVMGKVVDRHGDAFKATVPVALYAPSSVFEAMSDRTGAFEFKQAPTGHYQLQAITTGTKRTVMEVDVSESTPALEVTLSFALTSCEISMDTLPSYRAITNSPSQATLGGVITGLKGKPLDQVEVKVVHSATHAESIAHTDRHRNFNFESLSPGRYTLTVTRKGYSTATIPDIWAVAGYAGSVKPRMLVAGAMCQ